MCFSPFLFCQKISIELESLAKKTKEKVEVKEEEKTNKETFANVATAAMKKAEEEKPKSSKSRPGGGFRQRFNTGDVRMFNLKKEEREALDDSDEETVDSANGSRNKEDPPPPPPPPKATERLTPVISQMGKKWATEAKVKAIYTHTSCPLFLPSLSLSIRFLFYFILKYRWISFYETILCCHCYKCA